MPWKIVFLFFFFAEGYYVSGTTMVIYKQDYTQRENWLKDCISCEVARNNFDRKITNFYSDRPEAKIIHNTLFLVATDYINYIVNEITF